MYITSAVVSETKTSILHHSQWLPNLGFIVWEVWFYNMWYFGQ